MRSKSKIAIIGGTGSENIPQIKDFKTKTILTKYGIVRLKEGTLNRKIVVFLPRHGLSYKAPHQINYRANIAALKQEKVDYILATAACGSLNKKIKPGDFLLLSDFIDFTKNRIESFADIFFDISEPYNNLLNKELYNSAIKLKLRIHKNAVYVCTEGPRFETRAEIKAYRSLGADVVGMTQVPEVILAAEAKIPYAALGVATNYAAGMQRKVSSGEVASMMKEKARDIFRVFSSII